MFPSSIIGMQFIKGYPRTQWSSFDKKSFFPHTDLFKAKVAIAHEDYFLLNALLDRKFDLNQKIETQKGLTPLALASLLGKEDLVEYLFSRGADLNTKDIEGNTPLMLAVIYDHPNTVKKLVELGAKIDETDIYGYSARDKAINRGKTELSSFLDSVDQQLELPIVKPFTFRLENYEVITTNKSKEIIEKYDINRYFKPQVYPFYKFSKGFLAYFFHSLDLQDIELHASASVYYNKRDDKTTSDQNLFTFGEILKQRNS
jgi:ankyrin repeat protein